MWRRGLVVGLSGVSCGGKTTVSKLLQTCFPWASVVHQDAYFHPNDPKYHVLIPKLNHFNWELKSALDLNKMEQDVAEIIQNEKKDRSTLVEKARFFPNDAFVTKNRPDDSTVKILTSRYSSVPLTIIEGHVIFNHKPFYHLCNNNLRFFFTLDREECFKRRTLRVYDPPNPPGFFELCVWPAYAERLKDVQKLKGITYFDAKNVPLIQIYKDIFNQMTIAMEDVILDDKKTEEIEQQLISNSQALKKPASNVNMESLV